MRTPHVLAIALALAVFATPHAAFPAAGELDPAFNGTGKQTLDVGGTMFGGGYDTAAGVVVQPDGKIVVAVNANDDGLRHFGVLRYNPNGSLDTSFNGTGLVLTDFGVGGQNIPYGMALQSDGKIVLVGEAGGRVGLARYNTDGTLDATFGGDGKVVTSETPFKSGRDVVIQPDGKLVVAMEYVDGGNVHWLSLIRFNADGTLDTDFGEFEDGWARLRSNINVPGGAWFDSNTRGIALQSDGKIVLVGYGVVQFQNGQTEDIEITRFNDDGSWDTTFGLERTDFGLTSDQGHDVAVLPDGKILVAGNSGGNFALVRYDTDGALDTTFNGTGKVTTDFGGSDDSASAMILQGDGKIILCGWTNSGGAYDFALARYNANGTLDTSFDDGDGKLITPIGSGNDFGIAVAQQADGAIVAAGSADGSSNTDVAVARYTNPVPEIVVEQPGGAGLTDGSATPVAFGSIRVGVDSPSDLVFTIKNLGAAELTGLTITKNGTDAGMFSVIAGPTAPVGGPTGSTTFTVRFLPTSAGAKSAALHIASNDLDETSFDIAVSGTGVAPQFGAIAFDGGEIMEFEGDKTIHVPITRTGGSDGAVSVRVTTQQIGAGSDDFIPLDHVLVTFADGEVSKTVPVTLINDALQEGSEAFNLALSDPQGGATLGWGLVTIQILDPDNTPPAVAINNPVAGSLHQFNMGGLIEITGNATDDIAIKQVQVSLNGGGYVDAVLVRGGFGPGNIGFRVHVTPQGGLNTARVKSIDYTDKVSAIVTRTFTVERTMTVSALPSASGSVTPALAGSAFREIGKSYSVTATPNAGKVFTGWTLVGPSPQSLGMAASALEKPAINFIFREELTLTANFADNPYGASVIGTYTGLIRADGSRPDRPNAEPDGTPPGLGSEGYFTATVTNTGAFSGKLTLDGFVLNVAGIFDHQGRARFGTARAFTQTVARLNKPSYTVKFDIGGVPGSAAPVGKITGEVSATEFKKSVLAAVSTLSADRAPYTGLAGGVVPDAYLTVTGTAASPAGRTDGVFTVALPSVPLGSQPLRISSALKEGDYPKGSGVGTLKVTKGGAVTLTATLADGTAMTVSGKLSEDLRVALFAQLYNLKGFLSTELKLDTQADNDVKPAAGSVVHWSRPFSGTSHYYPLGWAQTIELELLGGKYAVTGGQSVMRAAGGVFLQAADEDGNVTLSLSDGLIEAPGLVKSANLSPGDVVTKVPDNDPTFTMKVNRATGMITGMFDHTDDTKPSYTAVILQKGPSAGAQGFFLTKQPTPIDFTGESGVLRLIGQ
jgi:uncharacterized delta-60 repeat protein